MAKILVDEIGARYEYDRPLNTLFLRAEASDLKPEYPCPKLIAKLDGINALRRLLQFIIIIYGNVSARRLWHPCDTF